MRITIAIAVLLACAGATAALDLGSHAGPKPPVNLPPNIPGDRQGGDTIADATPITIPGYDTGTTAGYTDDYDVVCPFGGTSPDVVYVGTPAADIVVDIDLFGSDYDTKVYVFDEELNVVACNDDFYADYVSKIEQLALQGGALYYIIVDGWSGDYGNYVLDIREYVPCVLECPAGAEQEGEPPLVQDYVDTFNNGCSNSEYGINFDTITSEIFCGVSGWYLFQGLQYRDTDWFELVVPESGFIEILGDAEQPTYLLEIGPMDCNTVDVIQDLIVGPCEEGTLVIPGEPGGSVWFWVGPTTFEGPVDMYDYVLYSNLGEPTAVADRSWTEVKSLFR